MTNRIRVRACHHEKGGMFERTEIPLKKLVSIEILLPGGSRLDIIPHFYGVEVKTRAATLAVHPKTDEKIIVVPGLPPDELVFEEE